VIPHSFLVVSDHTFIYAQHLARLDHQSRLFVGFTGHRFAQSFAAFEDAAGQRPLAQQRWLSAADQQDAMVVAMMLDDHRAHAHQRRLRVFTFHRVIISADYFAPT
jgi:hypothetical protein